MENRPLLSGARAAGERRKSLLAGIQRLAQHTLQPGLALRSADSCGQRSAEGGCCCSCFAHNCNAPLPSQWRHCLLTADVPKMCELIKGFTELLPTESYPVFFIPGVFSWPLGGRDSSLQWATYGQGPWPVLGGCSAQESY